MVEKVNPSPNRPADAFTTAGAIAYGGGADTGYVVPAGSPTELSTQDSGITEGSLNEFTETSSASSLSVSIDAGEAFIFGSWVVIDDSPARSITLASSTLDQTVYVGWAKGTPNDVIVGLDSDFAADDQRIPLYEFDTDGSGVTSVTDLRNVGDTFDSEGFNTDVDARGNIVENAGHDEVDVPQVRNLTAENWESGRLSDSWVGNRNSWSVVSSDSYLGEFSVKSVDGISNEQITSNNLSAVPQMGDKIEVYFKTTDPSTNRLRFAFGQQEREYDPFKGHGYTVRFNSGNTLRLSKDGETVTAISNNTNFDTSKVENEWAKFTVFWGTDGRIDARITRLSDGDVLARVGIDDPNPYESGNIGLDGSVTSGNTILFDDILIERREAEAAANTLKGLTEAGNELTPSGAIHTGPRELSENATRGEVATAPVTDQATQGEKSLLTLLRSGISPAAYVERTMDGQGGAYGHQIQGALGRFARINSNLSWEYDALSDVPTWSSADGGTSGWTFSLTDFPRRIHVEHDGSAGSFDRGGVKSSALVSVDSFDGFAVTFEDVSASNNDLNNNYLNVGLTDQPVDSNASVGNGVFYETQGTDALVEMESGARNGRGLTSEVDWSITHDVTIEYDGDNVRLYIDGALEAEHTSYTGSGSLAPFIQLADDGDGDGTGEIVEVQQITVEPLPEVLQ